MKPVMFAENQDIMLGIVAKINVPHTLIKKINKRRGEEVCLNPNIVRRVKNTEGDHQAVKARSPERKVIKLLSR
jgi:hypothetical protein